MPTTRYPPYHSESPLPLASELEIKDSIHRTVTKYHWLSIIFSIATNVIHKPKTATQLLDTAQLYLIEIQETLASERKKYNHEELGDLTKRYFAYALNSSLSTVTSNIEHRKM